MPDYIKKTINTFVESVLNTQQKLGISKGEINQKVLSIEAILSAFYEKVQDYTNLIKNAGGGELGALAHTEVQQQLNILKKWRGQIDLYRKGVTFISKFEESCIVVVYGKVKAGKSTLGNFIRGKQIASSNLKTSYSELKLPPIQIYDKGLLTTADELHEIDEANEFGVKSTEATRIIQWFTLGGLSWVDTPGIGSVTTENEKLAQEYVQNADLVLYLTNSDAAGAKQDFQELKFLQERNKPICLVVTRCDQVEEDEDASGNLIKRIVPKPEKDIRDIESWIIKQVQNFNISDILNKSSILSISVKLAQDAIKNADDNLFRASKMDRLYESLAEIMTDKAIEYKRRNPQAKMNSLIEDILQGKSSTGSQFEFAGLHALQKTYEDFLKILDKKDRECRHMAEKSAQILRSTGTRIIQEIVEKHNAAHINGNYAATRNLETEINEALERVSKEILINEIKKLISDFQIEVDSITLNRLQGNTQIESKQETVTWKEKHYEREYRDPVGLFECIGFWCGKEYHSTSSYYITHSKQIEIGTNASEIADILLQQFVSSVIPSFENSAQSLGKNYFSPLKKSLKSILEAAKQAESSLLQCRF